MPCRGTHAGYWLLRVLDVLAPGAVDWRAAHRPPLKPLLRRPQSVENCNQARRLPMCCNSTARI